MQIEDLKQLCEACKRSKNPNHDLNLIKNFYQVIEEHCTKENQQTIINKLRKTNFNLNIVQILNKKFFDSDIDIINDFFDSDTNMDFINRLFDSPGLIEYIAPILLSNKVDDEMKFDFLDASQKIYAKIKDHCKLLNEEEKATFIHFLEERFIPILEDGFSQDTSEYFATCQDIYEKAIDTFKTLDINQIMALTNFLSNQELLKRRSDYIVRNLECGRFDDIKTMGEYYIEQGLSKTVYAYLTHEKLLKTFQLNHQIEFLKLSEQVNHNEKLFDVFDAISKDLDVRNFSYCIEVLKEVIASNFNEKTISLIKTYSFKYCTSTVQYQSEFLLSLRETYRDETRFKTQLREINDIDSFIGYLGEIEKDKGNCDIKPKTMVKKFNEGKPEK